MTERIQTLDGLRFIAALGVLWIHTWTVFGNTRAHIYNVDIASIMAIGVNGVDLFFVISGFCMYFFYAKKTIFNYTDFLRFLKKRWFRLSPAFYVATIIYILVSKYILQYPGPYKIFMLTSLVYANGIIPQYSISNHFWTLSVEWQFYLIIPFILLYQRTLGFRKIFLGIFLSLQAAAVLAVLILARHSDILTNQLLFRGIEFGCGVVVARLILINKYVLKHRWLWLMCFIIIVYTGRVCVSKNILALSDNYYNLFKIAGFTLMGVGFAGILYMAITSNKYLFNLLGNPLFKTMGKISYSFYLWHNLAILFIAPLVAHISFFSNTFIAPVICTLICTIILYPVSWLSYNLLEKPFLRIGNLTTK